MRTLVVLLSLALFFLTGMVIGMDYGNQADQAHDEVSTAGETVDDVDEQQVVVEKTSAPSDKEPEMSESPEHLTQKTATLLESGVKGFYELIVGMAYDLVSVFF